MITNKNKCTNKFSISGLIGVHLSSIVKWGYQDNFKPVNFFFFWRKDFACTKTHHKEKSTNKTKNKLTLNNKGNNFSRMHKLLSVTCFCAYEIFLSKKRINRLEIVWISSFFYTTFTKFWFSQRFNKGKLKSAT